MTRLRQAEWLTWGEGMETAVMWTFRHGKGFGYILSVVEWESASVSPAREWLAGS